LSFLYKPHALRSELLKIFSQEMKISIKELLHSLMQNVCSQSVVRGITEFRA